MHGLENWGFMLLIGCLLFVVLSLTVLTGIWATVANVAATVLGILSGGIYGVSAYQRR